jgi:hypothetical protein
MSNLSTKMTWLPKTQFKLGLSKDLREPAKEFCKKYFDKEEWHIKEDVTPESDILYFKTYDNYDHFIHGSDQWTIVCE